MIPAWDGTPPPCPECHLVHGDVSPLLGPIAPDAWMTVSEGERMEAVLTPDICILPDDGRIRHFVRGHIQLPVLGGEPSVFVWSAWVELDEASMSRVARSWSDPNRAAIPPLVGLLANELPYEQPTRGLAIRVHTRDPGLVPLLIVAEPHALAAEQRDGVSLHRMAQFSRRLQHL